MAEIRFITDLGAEVSVAVEGGSAREVRQGVLRALREYGQLGWRGVTIPPGGLRFPLANEPDFDWRLLGARPGTRLVEGEERPGVWHDGQIYTRREFPPNPRMKLGPAVKYSRGARSSDPPEVVEEGDGSFRYVTLAVFRGEGRRREEYATPAREGELPSALPSDPRSGSPAVKPTVRSRSAPAARR